MTPAPISVERFDLYGVSYVRATDHDASIAALLHQIAEMSADLEREQGVREDAQRQLRAAERAREEACGLLRDVWNRDGGKECRCINISRDTEREYENGHCPHQRIAAFLAASGGNADD